MMLLSVESFSLAFRRYDGLFAQRDIRVLHDLDFSLDRGEMLALVGASGAGKSLLAHALLGILPPNGYTEGMLCLDGLSLDRSSIPRLCGKRIGLVPQSISHLDPLARCGRQMAWAAERCGRPMTKSALETWLHGFGLDSDVGRAFPHQLSGGMARRLMLAMATVGEPDLIVADEPTSGLDPDNARIVLNHLRRLADKGKGVLLITHDMVQALTFTDRVAVLCDGRLAGIEHTAAFSGRGEDLASSYARALWHAMPDNDFALVEKRSA